MTAGSLSTCAALVALVASACATAPSPAVDLQAEGEPGAPAPARTLIIALRDEPQTLFNPAPVGGGLSGYFATRPFNAYLELVDDRGLVRPYLAEMLPELHTDTWQLLPDGRMETRYRLRPNLSWQDGVALSSEDFVFAWRVYTTPSLGFPAATTPPLNQMEELVALDARTLVIRWRGLYANAGNLQVGGSTNPGLPALPRHLLAEFAQGARAEALGVHPYWTTEFVGLGPYRLEQWELGTFIEATAFGGHALGRPEISRLRLVFIGDKQAALANMRLGTMHVAAGSTLEFLDGVALKREWAATNGGGMIATSQSWRAIWFQARPDLVTPRALLDVRVRRALAHAVDKNGLNEVLWGGEGILTDTIFAPRADFYPAIERAIAKYPYDLRTTERLMAEAGFTRGADGIFASSAQGPVALEAVVNASNAQERSIVAAGWRQAGFDVQEATIPLALTQDRQVRSVFTGALLNAKNASENSLTSTFTTEQIATPRNRWAGTNYGGWVNPEYDRLVAALNETLDPAERVEQRVRLARLVNDQLPAIPLYYGLNATVYLGSVQGPVPVQPQGTTGDVSWNIHEWRFG